MNNCVRLNLRFLFKIFSGVNVRSIHVVVELAYNICLISEYENSDIPLKSDIGRCKGFEYLILITLQLICTDSPDPSLIALTQYGCK